MIAYSFKQLLTAIPVLIGITLLAFMIGVASPGDPVYLSLTRDGVTEPTAADISERRHELKLDLPLHEQYAHWLIGILRGDFGQSIYSGEDIAAEMSRRWPVSLRLALLAFLWTVIFGLLMGALMTINKDRWLDRSLRLLTSLTMSMPSFWVGILLITLFSEQLHWLPSSGIESAWGYLLPSIVLSLSATGVAARLARANFSAEISKHYVLVANAKGLSERRIGVVHVFRNALIPLITYFGLFFAAVLGGTSVIEKLFALPGIGSYAIEAIFNRDYFVLQVYVLITGATYLLINWLIDISYYIVNPAIRSYEVLNK